MGAQALVTSPGEHLDALLRVMLVDVRSERRAVMRRVVEQAVGAGTVVAEVGTTSEALVAADHHVADVAVVEVQMPLAGGLAVIAALRQAQPTLVIVVCTFHRDLATQRLAEEAGADAYLVKPVNSRDLRQAMVSGRRVPGAVAVP